MLVDGEEEIETNTNKKRCCLHTHMLGSSYTVPGQVDRLYAHVHTSGKNARLQNSGNEIVIFYLLWDVVFQPAVGRTPPCASPALSQTDFASATRYPLCKQGFYVVDVFFFVWAALICYFIHSFCARLPVPFVLLGTAAHQTTWSEEMSELS